MLPLRPAVRVVPQVRQMSASAVISGPPANHISPAEKLCHGLVMAAACLSLPAYVLSNIRRYRGVE